MAVYTRVNDSDVESLLADSFNVGTLKSLEGISDGIENSNFFVSTTKGEFVLTLFERLPDDDVPYFMALTEFLADNGVHCARPVTGNDGQRHRIVNGKQAALVDRLSGASISDPTPHHTARVGEELGRLHRASVKFPLMRDNAFDLDWMTRLLDRLDGYLDADVQRVVDEEITLISYSNNAGLPTGTVHGDLFQDNVLFLNNEISGIIDFYYACTDALIYDIAIAINDWCFDENSVEDKARSGALMTGYQAQRTLEPAELQAIGTMCRRAAFRFWLSRLYDKAFPRDGEIVSIKDPDHFYNILMYHRDIQGAPTP